MNKNKKLKNPSPRYSANIFSRLIFWWLRSTLRRVKSNKLNAKVLYDVPTSDRCELLGNKLEKAWKRELDVTNQANEEKPRLWKAILRAFRWYFLQHVVQVFIVDFIIRIAQPAVAILVIDHFSPTSTSNPRYGHTCAGIFAFLLGLEALLGRQTHLQQLENGIRLRTACSALVYKKIMRLPCTSAGQSTKQTVTNLLAYDVANLEQFFASVHYIWVASLQVTVIIYLMYRAVGVAAFAAVLLMLVQRFPVQGYFNVVTSRLYTKVAAWTDERISLTSEVISKIRATKIYCWEKPVEKMIYLTRRYEIDILKIAHYARSINLASNMFNPHTSFFVAILLYVLLQNSLSAYSIFSAILYFIVLQETVTDLLPKTVFSVVLANVSISRIEEFLLLKEVEPNIALSLLSNDEANISLQSVTASWIEDSDEKVLQEIDVRVFPKQLCVIAGPTGSGKTSMLQLILGELRPSSGQVSANGAVSYASQSAWLFPETLRDNILCAELYDEERYEQIVDCCQLGVVFDRLDRGDRTRTNDAVLSVEERAKVHVARALYKDADIYLLDDCFEFLSDEIFEDCVAGFLKEKTRIVVKANVRSQSLREEAKIILINQGRVEFEGSLSSYVKSDQYIESSNTEEDNLIVNDSDVKNSAKLMNDAESNVEAVDEKESEETKELLTKHTAPESLYWRYFRASCSRFIFYILLLFFVLAELCSNGNNFFIAYWTNQEELRSKISSNRTVVTDNTTVTNSTISEGVEADALQHETMFYIYGSLIVSTVLLPIIRNALFFKICLSASERIHNDMFARLIRAPMGYFHANSPERILCRFSDDMQVLDGSLTASMLELVRVSFAAIGIALVLFAACYWTILPIFLAAFLYWRLIKFQLSVAQKIKLLESDAQDDAESHVESALDGLATIRSTRAQRFVLRAFIVGLDSRTSAHSLRLATTAGLGLWLDGLYTGLVALVAHSLVAMPGRVDAAYVGLVLQQVLLIGRILYLGMQSSEEVISHRANLEKIFKHTELKQEGPFEIENTDKQSKSWPTKGEIKFDNLTARYSGTDEPILRNLNFTIEAGSKVVIVENIDSSRSSLTAALYRLAETAEGQLLIDGVDVATLGLDELRASLAHVSTEPTFFSDTPRDNLDPNHGLDDALLWAALDDAKLTRTFAALDHSCSYLGSGKRKLLSLARAIVKRSRILVIEESPEDVDPTIEDLVRQIVKAEFEDSTVLTLTRTLRDATRSARCDKVLLLTDNGQAREYDCNGDGLFQEEHKVLSNDENQ